MNVPLVDSRHATQQRERTKNRPQEWNDSVDSFCATIRSRTHQRFPSYHEIRFGCLGVWQCFSLKFADYVHVIKCMLAILPLEGLLELNTHIASLVADGAAKKMHACSELVKSKSELQSKLRSVQSENWSLNRDIRHLERFVSELEEEAVDANEIIAS